MLPTLYRVRVPRFLHKRRVSGISCDNSVLMYRLEPRGSFANVLLLRAVERPWLSLLVSAMFSLLPSNSIWKHPLTHFTCVIVVILAQTTTASYKWQNHLILELSRNLSWTWSFVSSTFHSVLMLSFPPLGILAEVFGLRSGFGDKVFPSVTQFLKWICTVT